MACGSATAIPTTEDGLQRLLDFFIYGMLRASESLGNTPVFLRTVEEAGAQLDAMLASPGPGLLAAHLENDPSPDTPPGPWSQVEERALFMRRLAEEP